MSIFINYYQGQKKLKLYDFPFKSLSKNSYLHKTITWCNSTFCQNHQERAGVTERFPENDIHTHDIDIFGTAKLIRKLHHKIALLGVRPQHALLSL